MLEKVTDRIYYLMNEDDTDRPALGIVIGDNCSLVIDAGNSVNHAEEFKCEIEKLKVPPVKYVVATHHHWDHIWGLNAFDAVAIASEKTRKAAEIYCGIKLDDESLKKALDNEILSDFSVKCIKNEFKNINEFKMRDFDLTFQGQLEIDLGGTRCIIKEMINPHREDGTIIYVPSERTLFLGDAAYGCSKNGHNYYDRQKVQKMMDVVDSYEAEYYLCSHESICTREEIDTYWNQIKAGAELTENCKDKEEAINKFKEKYNGEPVGDDLFFIESFFH